MTVFAEVNYLAIFLCSLIALGINALWYNPVLLGKLWLDSGDKTEEEMRKGFKPIKAFGVSFISYLIMAYALARIMTYVNATTVTEGMRIGFLCWFGFTASTTIISALFEGKSLRVVLVDGGYHLIIYLIFGIILGVWH